MSENSDIRENSIFTYDDKLLDILLIDRTKSIGEEDHNIIWATDNYVSIGAGYGVHDEITVHSITGENGMILRPRVNKSKEEQEYRSRDKAEVFTAAWICNRQNNLIDKAWFGTEESPFNIETENGWVTRKEPVQFPEEKTWQDYVRDTRLEMACGEAPYLVSRYNVITGEDIAVEDRIGILDRKIRVINENVDDEKDWYSWVKIAYQNTYGFEWQGDNLVLAREAMLCSFRDYFKMKFGKKPTKIQLRKIAEIISWNLWQMDGLKGVIPDSCGEREIREADLFGESVRIEKCEGCEKDDMFKHNGTYCVIMDWDKKKTVRFVDLINKQ